MAGSFTLRGIITALVTPFTEDGRVDEEALRELLQFQLKSGVNGFFPLGTTGMGPAMEATQRKQVAEIVVEETHKRLPVIVQVGAANPTTSIDLAKHAEKIGADAVASLTPFYYQPGADAVLEHYSKLSQSTNLPLFVYNIPRNTGNNVDAKLLAKLSKIPRIVGIKDSSQDFSQLLDYLTVVPDGFNVINGTDSYLFSAFCAGVCAGVSATANAFPELFVEMYQAYKAGDFERGKALQIRVHSIRGVLSQPPIAPILEGLKLRGLKGGHIRPPLRSMNVDERAVLRASVSRLLPDLTLTA
jgi:4-hydroxy-tetrahydrodipicolinate synthase